MPLLLIAHQPHLLSGFLLSAQGERRTGQRWALEISSMLPPRNIGLVFASVLFTFELYCVYIWHTVLCTPLFLTHCHVSEISPCDCRQLCFHSLRYHIIFHCVGDMSQCWSTLQLRDAGISSLCYDRQCHQVQVAWCTCSGVSLGRGLFRFFKANFFHERAKKKKKQKVGGVELALFYCKGRTEHRIIKKKRKRKGKWKLANARVQTDHRFVCCSSVRHRTEEGKSEIT